jgi:predicted O-methyltransferase YrrM
VLAHEHLERAGLHAELLTQDAAATLAEATDGHYDLIFLDAERPAYAAYWLDLLRVLRRDGGLLAIDNVLSHPDEVVEVGELIDAEPTVARVELAIGAGVWLVARGA